MNIHAENIVTEDGLEAETFTITTRNGTASGLYSHGVIYVHHIHNHSKQGKGCMKGIMGALCRRYDTNTVVFTPVINSNLPNKVRGLVKTIPAEDPKNPYGEDIQQVVCDWKV